MKKTLKNDDAIYTAHKKILEICEPLFEQWKSYWSDNKETYIKDIYEVSKNQISIMDYNYDYWLMIPYSARTNNTRYIKINDYISIVHFKDAAKDKENGSGYSISWSDDGRQPSNEWLVNISFPTGWYMLHSSYAPKTFNDMREELKSYWPKYCDSQNNHMYFPVDEAKEVSRSFNKIIQKYRGLASVEIKEKEINDMEEKLKKLKEKA